eukprot:2654432-Alexandrium_andersonii.AAC.1
MARGRAGGGDRSELRVAGCAGLPRAPLGRQARCAGARACNGAVSPARPGMHEHARTHFPFCM